MKVVNPVNEGKRGSYTASPFQEGVAVQGSLCIAQLVPSISFRITLDFRTIGRGPGGGQARNISFSGVA